jgi:DNA mismatch endonuclease (patch repair protein)
MKAIRATGTKIEVALSKALWSRGIRYRKNDRSVFGTPDISIKKRKIAVFVDSEYWHGKDWNKSKFRIKTNRKFWWKKIESNIQRDKIVNRTLRRSGWIVFRFWGAQIEKNLELCILKIELELNKRRDG